MRRVMWFPVAGLPAGLNNSSTCTLVSGHCLRAAYIRSVCWNCDKLALVAEHDQALLRAGAAILAVAFLIKAPIGPLNA